MRIKRGGLVYTHTLTIDAHTEDLCIHKPLYRQSPEKVHIYTKFALLYTKSMNIYTNSRYMGFVVHKLNDQKAQVHKTHTHKSEYLAHSTTRDAVSIHVSTGVPSPGKAVLTMGR